MGEHATGNHEEGVRRTLALYAQLCDDGRFAEWADLFTPEARFHVMGATRHGRKDIEAFISEAMPPDRRGKHALLATVVDVAADGLAAQAWTDYVFVTPEGRITSVGRYHDELVRAAGAGDDGRWRFSLREIVFVGGSPELAQPVPG